MIDTLKKLNEDLQAARIPGNPQPAWINRMRLIAGMSCVAGAIGILYFTPHLSMIRIVCAGVVFGIGIIGVGNALAARKISLLPAVFLVGGFAFGMHFQSNVDEQTRLNELSGDIVMKTLLTSMVSSYALAVDQYETPTTQALIHSKVMNGIIKLPIQTSKRSALEAGILGPDREFARRLAYEIYQVDSGAIHPSQSSTPAAKTK